MEEPGFATNIVAPATPILGFETVETDALATGGLPAAAMVLVPPARVPSRAELEEVEVVVVEEDDVAEMDLPASFKAPEAAIPVELLPALPPLETALVAGRTAVAAAVDRGVGVDNDDDADGTFEEAAGTFEEPGIGCLLIRDYRQFETNLYQNNIFS